MTIYFRQSPNFTPTRSGHEVDTIIYHWINGDLALADAAFARPQTRVSAHFAVEDTTVHQYVKLEHTAWGAGNFAVNQRSVNIEHSAQPGRDASETTCETSAHLVFEVAQKLGKRVGDLRHLPHKAIKATACPGTLDIDRIVRRALELEQQALGGIDQPVGPATPATPVSIEKVPTPPASTFWVTITSPSGLKVRTAPHLTAPEVKAKSLKTGNTVECIQAIMGDDPYGTGNNVWLKTKHSGLYIWSGGTNYHK